MPKTGETRIRIQEHADKEEPTDKQTDRQTGRQARITGEHKQLQLPAMKLKRGSLREVEVITSPVTQSVQLRGLPTG
ncbi:hypothetical protein E2C01_090968 [Portunus trituberculatus]|uniref:Uncharacterized protein n=1 Tax=Portunus trituberculatus TaxID=210409 RepID=A0A5B7JMS8_PORTR|nr:hypothetical protein [Portunus trituberculatus]